MPTLITVAGANFSANALAVVPPAIAGLQTWCLFGTDLAHSQNQVPGGPALTAVGTPGYGSNYVLCTGGSNYFDTNLAMSSAGTIIVAANMASASGLGALAGNYDGTNGVGFQIVNTGIYTAGGGIAGAVNMNAGINLAVISAWGLYALTFQNGAATSISALTVGTSGSGAAVTRVLNSTTMKVGTFPDAGALNIATPTEIGFLAQWQDVALTPTQLTSLLPSIRAALSARGITV